MKIQAAVLRQSSLPTPYSTSRPLTIEEVELDPPGPGEILVRIGAAGLCHSDLSVVEGTRPRPLPMVLGHEAAGTVVQCGPGVTGLTPGDQVVFSFVPACGRCAPCAAGRAALCEPGAQANSAGTLLGGQTRLRGHSGEPLHHHLGISAFAQFCVASACSAVRLANPLPMEIAALFGCAVLTGVGAAVHTARIEAGQSAAIFGLGGVGMAALLGARAAGATPLLAIDLNESKLALAQQLGAHPIQAAGANQAGGAAQAAGATQPDLPAIIRELTNGGVDYAIESVGSERVFAQAFASTRRGGTTIAVGLPPPDRMLSIPAVTVVAEERTLRGSYMGSSVPSRDIPRFIELYRAGLLPVDRLLTHRLRLGQINQGLDRLARGEAIRQVILFD